MVRLWRLYQGGGMGVGPLPDAGGSMDQSIAMMAAFDLLSGYEAREKDEQLPPLDADGNFDNEEFMFRNSELSGDAAIHDGAQ